MSTSGFNWSPYIAVTALTDIGLTRGNNQDSHLVSLAGNLEDWWHDGGHLFVVADGMGAHAAGELASKLAVDQVSFLYRKHRDQSPTDAILHAIRTANDEIHRRGQANLSFHNMGTTCSALLLLPQGAVVAHVGDSRVYRLRRGVLNQLTFDHSLVWEMQQATQAKGGTDVSGIPKNVITRSIGPHPAVKVDLEGPFPIEVGDTFLLCSDGLTGRIDDTELASALTYLSSADAAKYLVDLAVLRGGKDNITVIVAQVLSDQLATRPGHHLALTITEGEEPPRRIWVGFWIGLGVSLLCSVFLLAMGQFGWAWAALATSLISLAGIAIQAIGSMQEGVFRLARGSTLGKAPYTKTMAVPREVFVKNLQSLVEEASQAARNRQWESSEPLHGHAGHERTGPAGVTAHVPEALSDVQELLTRTTQLADLCRKYLRPCSGVSEDDWTPPPDELVT